MLRTTSEVAAFIVIVELVLLFEIVPADVEALVLVIEYEADEPVVLISEMRKPSLMLNVIMLPLDTRHWLPPLRVGFDPVPAAVAMVMVALSVLLVFDQLDVVELDAVNVMEVAAEATNAETTHSAESKNFFIEVNV